MIKENIYSAYNSALLQGDRITCFKIVESLLQQNIGPHAIYTELFQRSLYEVGEMWERNKISVAVEHMATSITELLLASVYPYATSGKIKRGKKAVISCSVNEFHQIGARIVADTMDMEGWDVSFLGANTPTRDLLSLIQDRKPELLGLSLSIYFGMSSLIRTIEEVRAAFPGLHIVVGGQAFRWGGKEMVAAFSDVDYIPTLEELKRLAA